MKNFKTIALTTAACISLSPALAQADGFTSHHLVDEEPYEHYVEKLPGHEKLEVREYLNYEHREPCQFYQPIPQGFMRDGCDIVRVEPKKVVAVQVQKRDPMTMSNVITDYEVHFAFDSAELSPEARATLNQVADEIERYNPREVTVEGHTDTAGPSDYNIALSERRAKAVSQALTNRDVTNRVIDEEAVGENDLAVETGDEVPLRENRRVTITFRK